MPEHQFIQFALLLVVGTLSGFINTLAGGGSFLTVPLLIFMGLPPTVANGTNRLGIFLQCLFALVVFIAAGKVQILPGLVLGVGNVIGALAGAKTTVTKGSRFIRPFVTATILAFAVLLFFR